MAKINLVSKKTMLPLWDIVKFQIITHCYISRIALSDCDMDCLTLLSLNDTAELYDFCNAACTIPKRDRPVTLKHTREIFKSPQTVRNCLSKLERINIITKEGSNKKKISVNPELKIQHEGNILLDYKLGYIEPEESKGAN
jgi:hypothetical protein